MRPGIFEDTKRRHGRLIGAEPAGRQAPSWFDKLTMRATEAFAPRFRPARPVSRPAVIKATAKWRCGGACPTGGQPAEKLEACADAAVALMVSLSNHEGAWRYGSHHLISGVFANVEDKTRP